MGDAGANLLGYLLGVTAVVGSLKTGAVVALVVPLAILAIPFLDTGFVIAKRLKYRQSAVVGRRQPLPPPDGADRLLAAQDGRVPVRVDLADGRARGRTAADLPPRAPQAGWIAFLVVYAIVCLAASVYLVYVLEIFKFKSLRTIELRRADPDTSEHEIEAAVERDIETGEFESVK